MSQDIESPSAVLAEVSIAEDRITLNNPLAFSNISDGVFVASYGVGDAVDICRRGANLESLGSPFGTHVFVDINKGIVIAERGIAGHMPVYISEVGDETKINFDNRHIRRSGVNYRALRDLLANRYPAGGAGLFNDGVRLRPGDRWVWTSASGRTSYVPFERIKRVQRHKSGDNVSAAVHAGVAENLAGHECISVLFSGGMDSSAVAWAASRDRETHLIYLDFTPITGLLAAEKAKAKAIAEALKLPFHTIPIHLSDLEPDYLFGLVKTAPNNMLFASGVIKAADLSVKLGATVICTGVFGDTLWKGSYQDDMYAAIRAPTHGNVDAFLAWLGTQPELSHWSRMKRISKGVLTDSTYQANDTILNLMRNDSSVNQILKRPKIGGFRTFNTAARHKAAELSSYVLEFWTELIAPALILKDPLRHPRIWDSVYSLPADRRKVVIGGTVVGKLAWREEFSEYFPTRQHESDRAGYAALTEVYLQCFAPRICDMLNDGLLMQSQIYDESIFREFLRDKNSLVSDSLGAVRLAGAEGWLNTLNNAESYDAQNDV